MILDESKELGKTIEADLIIRSKRRTMALEIRPDGTLIARVPANAPDAAVKTFIESKSDWINEKRQIFIKRQKRYRPIKFVKGEEIPYLGKRYPFKVIDGQPYALTLNDSFMMSVDRVPQARDVFILWYKARALGHISQRADLFASKMGLSFRKIRISDAKTRWGSCSYTGNLNFSWRLMMAPAEVVDYVVIHEIAHLAVRDHSRTFWDLVGRYCPEYKRHQKWLKDNGYTLNL